ncbi:unnamed protein product, partial [marine sediment metagenome]
PEGTEVKLTLLRGGHGEPEGVVGLERQGKFVDLTIVRAAVDIPIIETKILDDDIGYVWLRLFHKQAGSKLQAGLEELLDKHIRGLVLDLSINGGGLLEQAISVCNLFLDKQTVVYVQERNGEPQPYQTMPGTVIPEDLPIVILIDGSSASASEIVAAALQDMGRAKVVGQNSFGKSKVQTVMALNDHSALVLSTALYLTPNKRDLSQEYEDGKRGIKPDVVFPPLEFAEDEQRSR